MRTVAVFIVFLALLLPITAQAQDNTWLQIEAQPNLNTAIDRAHAYAAIFPDVEGYRLGSGWYGIALGPMTKVAAGVRLLDLRRQNLIPADSYLSDGASYRDPFWPVAGLTAVAPVAPAVEPAAIATAPVIAAEPNPEPEETPKQARASEAALALTDKQALQDALKWYGYYDGVTDGHIGAATRTAMTVWQTANATEPTGILTSKQRKALVARFKADTAEFGFETVSEAASGIEITLPLALIGFDRYEAPFVDYAPKANSGLNVLLISEPGGKASLSGLYDILQSLQIVPRDGERSLTGDTFTIRGRNAMIETLAFAKVDGGNVKGYLISWNLSDAERMSRILPAVQASFRSLGDKALDPGLVPLAAAAKRGLLAGLEMRKAKFSRSGFFVDGAGTVLTTVQAVTGCGHITLERSIDATVSFSDPASGLALLTPAKPLAPHAVAAFAAGTANAGARVSVAGYSYEDRLPAPVLTLGTVEDNKGLNGEPGLLRLSITALPGDAGGPVLGNDGAVIGMLLPPDNTGRQLPQGVAFAASASALTTVLTGKGLTIVAATATTEATPDALAAAARGMTVLVSCWE